MSKERSNDFKDGWIHLSCYLTEKYGFAVGGEVGGHVGLGPHHDWEGGDTGHIIGPDGNVYEVSNWHEIRRGARAVLKENVATREELEGRLST